MSVSVAYSSRVSDVWSATKTSSYLSNSLSSLAWYVRSFFDQVDTENSETRRFKTAFFSTGIALLLFSYLFVGWNKIIGLAHTFELSQTYIYVIHGVFGILIILGLTAVYRRIRYTQETLVHVLTGIDRMMNHRKSQRILTNMFFVSVFFVSALFFPLIMFVFELPLWTNIVSLMLLGISFAYFHITTRILCTYKSDGHAAGRLYNGISMQQLYKATPKPFGDKKNFIR